LLLFTCNSLTLPTVLSPTPETRSLMVTYCTIPKPRMLGLGHLSLSYGLGNTTGHGKQGSAFRVSSDSDP
jgi:hypothetical protein